MKRFTLTNQGLGTRIQQSNHKRHSKDLALSDKELAIVKQKRKERSDTYQRKNYIITKNGKRDLELLRQELTNGNISSKWCKHVDKLVSEADNAFIHMTERKWYKITETLGAHRIEQRKVQEAVNKMMGLM